MTRESDYLGKDARLVDGPSDSMARVAFGTDLDSYPELWKWLSVADIAHVLSLEHAKVIPGDLTTQLLAGLYNCHSEELPILDPSVGDLYNNRDLMLRRRLGHIADWIHTGRARREATTVAWHLETRQAIEAGIGGVADLIRSLVEVARANTGSLMTDFTYLQHAHPTTLAHYLLGFGYPLVRDLGRLREELSIVNRSPAGSGSVNGSRFDIDRDRLAKNLEFEGLIIHTRDAMWAPDMAIGPVAASMSAFVTLDRLAEELQLWATGEFGYFEPADRHARTSVIMPQKKNPYGLAMIRGIARTHLGSLVSVIATNLTPTGQPDNRVYSYGAVPRSLYTLANTAGLLAEHLRYGDFDLNRMQRAAGAGFTTATEICDWLAEQGVPNRQAHRLVGTAVRLAHEEGGTKLKHAHVVQAASLLDMVAPDIDNEVLDRLQDPAVVLADRKGKGSATDSEAMIGELDTILENLPTARFSGFEERYMDAVHALLLERNAF